MEEVDATSAVEAAPEQKLDDKAPYDPRPIGFNDLGGDAILVIPGSGTDSDPDTKFIVLSTVLRMASPVFKVLLTSTDFKEGLGVQQGLLPEIRLEEDDPSAMTILLSILHFRNPLAYFQLSPRQIAKVAAHCDKYDCIEAMKPWSSVWLPEKNNIAAKNVGPLLSAAFNFRSSSALKRLSSIAITGVGLETAAAWPKMQFICSVPDEMLGKQTLTTRLPSYQDLTTGRNTHHSKNGASEQDARNGSHCHGPNRNRRGVQNVWEDMRKMQRLVASSYQSQANQFINVKLARIAQLSEARPLHRHLAGSRIHFPIGGSRTLATCESISTICSNGSCR